MLTECENNRMIPEVYGFFEGKVQARDETIGQSDGVWASGL